MRGIGRELLPLATVLAITAAIVLVFPYGAIGFKARSPSPAAPAAAPEEDMPPWDMEPPPAPREPVRPPVPAAEKPENTEKPGDAR